MLTTELIVQPFQVLVSNNPNSYTASIVHIVSDNQNAPSNTAIGTGINGNQGFVVEEHPAYTADGVNYPAFNLDYEYEIGYVKTGPQGNDGDRGETGSIGPRGETGPLGPRGETGSIGPRGETGPMGPRGMTGQDGQDGQDGEGLNGVMSVTFYKILRGRYTTWKDPPPYISFNGNANNYNITNLAATPVSSLGPYITIDGKGPHDWAPLRDFEFFHLGAIGSLISGSDPATGSFPLDEHLQNTPANTYSGPLNNLALPNAGPPIPAVAGTRLGHNNFYGYRVPQKRSINRLFTRFCSNTK